VSFEEAAEMAFFGAKVLHPATMVPAMRKNIPVMVLNSLNPRSSGTCVRAHVERPKGKFTAIAAKKNISILNLAAPRMLVTHGFLHDVFEVFKRRQLPVDIVASSEVSLSLTVDSRIDISELLAELRAFTDAQVVTGKAIIAVVGENLRNRPGMLAYMFSAIADINVCMISQGASEITLSFVIDERDVPEAVRNLHHLLFPRPRKTARQSELPTGVAAGLSRGSAGVESLVFSTGEVEDTALSEVAD
jgi:aspartate kinase